MQVTKPQTPYNFAAAMKRQLEGSAAVVTGHSRHEFAGIMKQKIDEIKHAEQSQAATMAQINHMK